jgi:hypothetical protein
MSVRRWCAVIGTLFSVAFGCGMVSFVTPQSSRGGAAAAQQVTANGASGGTEGENAADPKASGDDDESQVVGDGAAGEAAAAQAGAATAKSQPAVAAPPRPDREPYRPIESAEFERARIALRERLGAFLQRLSTDPAPVRDGWKRFVQTDLVQSALDAPTFDKKLSGDIGTRLSSGKPGMEFTPVLALRRAYREFAELHEATTVENPAEYVGKLQDEVRTLLESLQASGTNYEVPGIGDRLARLRRLRQAPKLVESLDSRFNRENLFLQASRQLVAAGVEQNVDETSAVTDSILGVSVFGNARLRGRVTLGMVPCADRGRFELLLDGEALSSSTGYRKSVTLFSTSTTAVMARKSIELDERGLIGAPAVAACTTDNSLNDIAAKCCLVERIAWKRAQQSQGQAEALASASAERRIESRMDARSAELLSNANDSYQQKIRKPLIRRDSFPQSLRFQTTTEHLLGRSLQRNEFQLAAPTDPPAPMEGGDLAVRVHESYIRNMAEAILGGYRLTDEELERLYKENGREVPEELRVTETSTRWGFTFDERSPVEILLRDNQLSITVTAKKFVSGEGRNRTTVDRSMRISATYTFERANGVAEFVRKEDEFPVAEYVPQAGRAVSQSVRELAAKRLMSRKFNAMLKKRLPADFALPGRWAAGGQLVAKDCVPAGEWLSMVWNMAPLPAATAPANPAGPQGPAKPEAAPEASKPEAAQAAPKAESPQDAPKPASPSAAPAAAPEAAKASNGT